MKLPAQPYDRHSADCGTRRSASRSDKTLSNLRARRTTTAVLCREISSDMILQGNAGRDHTTHICTNNTNASSKTNRNAAQKEKNMAQWAYKVAYIDYRGRISSEGLETLIGNERRSTFARRYMNTLGQRGMGTCRHPTSHRKSSLLCIQTSRTGRRFRRRSARRIETWRPHPAAAQQ